MSTPSEEHNSQITDTKLITREIETQVPINPFLSKQSIKLPTQDLASSQSTNDNADLVIQQPKVCDPESAICKQSILSKTDRILNQLRHNCVNLSIYHNRRYHTYKNILFSAFRVPLILLSGCNSFIAVGTQNYISQSNISIINALLSILCGIVTSIELLLNLQKRMEQELESYKNYYKLSIEIFRFIKIDPMDREEASKDFLSKIYKLYEEYVTNGNAINVYRRGFTDEFEDINDDIVITEIPDTWYNYFCHCCY